MLTRREAVAAGVLAGVGVTVAGTAGDGAAAASPLEQDSTTAAASLAAEREIARTLASIRDESRG